MTGKDHPTKRKKVLKRRDTCVLPGEVNPDIVAKGESGEKICYYNKCGDCGRDDCIVFHPCIHKWICFNCKKTFGAAGERSQGTKPEEISKPEVCPTGSCPSEHCPIVGNEAQFCKDDETGEEGDDGSG